MHGFHHQHLRKRASGSALKPYPHPDFWIRILDTLTTIAGIVGPIMTMPQIVQIFSTRDAVGVSTLSWLAFSVLDIPFIVYGLVHRDRTITATYIAWFIANAVVAFGAILYG